jgi:hypothetical protein
MSFWTGTKDVRFETKLGRNLWSNIKDVMLD